MNRKLYCISSIGPIMAVAVAGGLPPALEFQAVGNFLLLGEFRGKCNCRVLTTHDATVLEFIAVTFIQLHVTVKQM